MVSKTIISSLFLFLCLNLAAGLFPPGASFADNSVIPLEKGASCVNTSCHAGMGKKKFVHAIGVNGKFCTRCHIAVDETVHAFSDLPENTQELCAQCHSEDSPAFDELEVTPPVVISADQARQLHEPFQKGKCTMCHNPHESDYAKHLKLQYPNGMYAAFSRETYTLCLSCHKKYEEILTTPRTLELTGFRNGNVNLHYMHVNKKKGRTCTICHHPHGLEDPKLIKSTFQFGNRLLTVNFEKTETGGKCETTCHRVGKYDRYKHESNTIVTSPIPGRDATEAELQESYEREMGTAEEDAPKK